MSDKICIKPLYGCGKFDPVCILLELGQGRILLDCGWDTNWKWQTISALDSALEEGPIDIILLSHGSIKYTGALAYLLSRKNCQAKVYCTIPVSKLTSIALTDAYAQLRSTHALQDLKLWSQSDVEKTFSQLGLGRIHPLKYKQQIKLSGKCDGITITPYCSGRTLGGTVWKITPGVHHIKSSVIYCMGYARKSEFFLNGLDIDEIKRPNILITDCIGVGVKQPITTISQRTMVLQKRILDTFQTKGNVLIPSTSTSRALTVLRYLTKIWNSPKDTVLRDKLRFHPIYFLSSTGTTLLKEIQQLVEYMTAAIEKRFLDSGSSGNTISFPHVRFASSIEHLVSLHQAYELEQRKNLRTRGPAQYVCVAVGPDLRNDFAMQMFYRWWMKRPENLILLTDRCSPDTTSAKLLIAATRRKKDLNGDLLPIEISFEYAKKVPMPEGSEELRKFQEQKLEEYEQKIEEAEAESLKAAEPIEDSSSEDEIEEIEEVIPLQMGPSKKRFKKFQTRRISRKIRNPIIEPSNFDILAFGERVHVNDFSILAVKGEVKVKQIKSINQQVKQQQTQALCKRYKIDWDKEWSNPCKTKIVKKTEKILCRVGFLDLSGTASSRDIQQVCKLVYPTTYVLVSGFSKQKDELRKYLVNTLSYKKSNVYLPNNLQQLEISNSFRVSEVSIPYEYFESLEFKEFKSSEVELARSLPPTKCMADPSIPYLYVGSFDMSDIVKFFNEKASKIKCKVSGDVLQCTYQSHMVVLAFDRKKLPMQDSDIDSISLSLQERYKLFFKNQEATDGVLRKRKALDTSRIRIQGSLSPLYFQIKTLLRSFFLVL